MDGLERILIGERAKFAPVVLAADDELPKEIILLLGYRDLPEVAVMGRGLAMGLEEFPHLTGRFEGRWGAGEFPKIVSGKAGEMVLEYGQSEVELGGEDFKRLSRAELREWFVPSGVSGGEGPLVAMRRVDFVRSGRAIFCLRVSHAAVDGAGLGMFLWESTRGWRGGARLGVRHRRDFHFLGEEGEVELPPGYVEGSGEGAANEVGETGWFSVERVALERGSGMDFGEGQRWLGAWLCEEMAVLDRSLKRVAVWINTRGRGGIPQDFTGNAGVYVEAMMGRGVEGLTAELRRWASRPGLLEARRRHRAILGWRSQGRAVSWGGGRGEVLELNLVSPMTAAADFGTGRPDLAVLLERNSSGLRILPTDGGGGFLVEVTGRAGLGEELFRRVRAAGFEPKWWGRGGE